mmetsp:Transcript_690/g.1200  ORF Transcript_690/g.1200 Transcript_690/m.1200 type:complete len:134 (-) Transcript_690:633-1034(-)
MESWYRHLVATLLLGLRLSTAFTPALRPVRTPWRHQTMIAKDSISDRDYAEKLQEAAADPEKFASFVSEKTPMKEKTPERIGRYQRIEDWDADCKAQTKKGMLSWEEQVQFESRNHGDQFRQNEILRQNLKFH